MSNLKKSEAVYGNLDHLRKTINKMIGRVKDANGSCNFLAELNFDEFIQVNFIEYGSISAQQKYDEEIHKRVNGIRAVLAAVREELSYNFDVVNGIERQINRYLNLIDSRDERIAKLEKKNLNLTLKLEKYEQTELDGEDEGEYEEVLVYGEHEDEEDFVDDDDDHGDDGEEEDDDGVDFAV